MSRRQLVLVIAGSIVALLIVAYAGNHSKNKTEERERIADIAPTEQDFDRWGLTCMETLFDLYGELPEPELFAGCVLAHKQGLVP